MQATQTDISWKLFLRKNISQTRSFLNCDLGVSRNTRKRNPHPTQVCSAKSWNEVRRKDAESHTRRAIRLILAERSGLRARYRNFACCRGGENLCSILPAATMSALVRHEWANKEAKLLPALLVPLDACLMFAQFEDWPASPVRGGGGGSALFPLRQRTSFCKQIHKSVRFRLNRSKWPGKILSLSPKSWALETDVYLS